MTTRSTLPDIGTAAVACEAERPLRIVMLVGGLDVGGAERQAITLAHGLRVRGHRATLASLHDGPLRATARDLDVPVRILQGAGDWSPLALPSLIRLLREERADVVYAFLEVQWLLALAARIALPRTTVVLGLRTSQYNVAAIPSRGRIVHALARRFAHRADLLVANSAAGLADFKHHARHTRRALGPGVVIGNGIDTTSFRPDPHASRLLRQVWGIPDDARVVGHVGRLDPVKDHELLLHAFAKLGAQSATGNEASRAPHLVCVGEGPAERTASLKQLAHRIGIAERVIWAGRRADMNAVYSAFDVLALSSRREGFPNVVAEAMACGVPAVVTDTGASAELVADLGAVVPAGDVDAFASGLQRMLDRGPKQLSSHCRDRIEHSFTVDHCAQDTLAALLALVSHRAI